MQMLEILQSHEDIESAESEFRARMSRLPSETVTAYVGYRGGRYDGGVRWYPELGFWYVTQIVRDGRQYWNGFGTEKPTPDANLSITCEINSPVEGIDRRIGGAFAKDAEGCVWIVHRGKIGGGRPGIGKSSFANGYRGEWVVAEDGDRLTDVVPISPLESGRLAIRVNGFIREVARIKTEAVGADSFDHGRFFAGFTAEFSGQRAKYTSSPVESSCDHGIVVNALAAEVESRGLRPHSDIFRDLYVRGAESGPVGLFEVKTGSDRTSLYCGVGQVLLHSAALGGSALRVLVLPKAPEDPRLGKALRDLDIGIVTFELEGHLVRFAGLDDVLRQLAN
jgi:hypothetical protein